MDFDFTARGWRHPSTSRVRTFDKGYVSLDKAKYLQTVRGTYFSIGRMHILEKQKNAGHLHRMDAYRGNGFSYLVSFFAPFADADMKLGDYFTLF